MHLCHLHNSANHRVACNLKVQKTLFVGTDCLLQEFVHPTQVPPQPTVTPEMTTTSTTTSTTQTPITPPSHLMDTSNVLSNLGLMPDLTIDYRPGLLTTMYNSFRIACYNDPFGAEVMNLEHNMQLIIDSLSRKNVEWLCTVGIRVNECHVQSFSHVEAMRGALNNRRVRRYVDEDDGWWSWKWRGMKSMFGTMDNTDAKMINIVLKNHTGVIQQMQSNLVQLSNTTFSISRSFQDALLRIETNTNNEFKALTSRMSAWSSTVRLLLERHQDTIDISNFMTFGHNIILGVQDVTHRLSQVRRRYATLIDLIKTLATVLRRKSFPTELLSLGDLEQAKVEIDKKLPADQSTVPTDHIDELFAQSEMLCITSEGQVLMAFKIPVIKNSMSFTTWSISHVPFQVGQSWFELDTAIQGVTIDADHQIWQAFTTAELALCESNSLRLCPFTPVTHIGYAHDCITQLITENSQYKNSCKARPVTDFKDKPVYTIPLGENAWLVSTSLSGVSSNLKCKHSSTGLITDETRLLKGIQVVRLPKDCQLNVADFSLIGSPYSYTSSSNSNPFRSSMNELLKANVKPLSTMWSELTTSTNDTGLGKLDNFFHKTNDVKVEIDSIAIDAIERIMHNASQISVLLPPDGSSSPGSANSKLLTWQSSVTRNYVLGYIPGFVFDLMFVSYILIIL